YLSPIAKADGSQVLLPPRVQQALSGATFAAMHRLTCYALAVILGVESPMKRREFITLLGGAATTHEDTGRKSWLREPLYPEPPSVSRRSSLITPPPP